MLLVAAVVCLFANHAIAETTIVGPFESADPQHHRATPLDKLVLAKLRAKEIQPANSCSDDVFVRRVYLDVIGTLPTLQEIEAFRKNPSANKRALLIDELLVRDEFADYWTMKWCDLLRVRSEFPINLWPNAVQAYERWIHHTIQAGMPYDQFARELLTSSGSNFRVPQVNFYRAVQGQEPNALASAVALTFMGTRLETWDAQERANFEAIFAQVAFKGTAEWKEEIVYLDRSSTEPVFAVFPGGMQVEIPATIDPRSIFADWLIDPKNPWFTRNIANRVWAWTMGRGVIHEPDDLRPDNPPSNPALMAYLEKELVGANYDLQHLFRLILNSRTYQQSSIPRSDHPDALALFAYYPSRRLEAEVLIDALCAITGTQESYRSMIPEPFTWVPASNRSITLADGSITSKFLEMFGRPARDSGRESERNNQTSDEQLLHLLNSTHIQDKIAKSGKLKALFNKNRKNPDKAVRMVYRLVLSRPPSQEELGIVKAYRENPGIKGHQVYQDLVWALVNSKEFLFRH